MTEDFLRQFSDDMGFSPCEHCANILTKYCLNGCIQEGKYRNFKINPGTSIDEVDDFPLEDVLSSTEPHYRLTVIAIYLNAIVETMKHREEFQFRANARYLKRRVTGEFLKEGLKYWRRRNGRDNDPT